MIPQADSVLCISSRSRGLLKNSSSEPDAERHTRSVTHGPSRNAAILAELFSEERVQDAFLSHSFLFERARGGASYFQQPPQLEHQQSA